MTEGRSQVWARDGARVHEYARYAVSARVCGRASSGTLLKMSLMSSRGMGGPLPDEDADESAELETVLEDKLEDGGSGAKCWNGASWPNSRDEWWH